MSLGTDDVERLLHVFAFEYSDILRWSVVDGELQFFVMCSDIFSWGCADGEAIVTAEDVDDLERTLVEVREATGEDWPSDDWALLWIARRRRTRPQGAAYRLLDEELWPLFDAAGPDRRVDFFNPKPRPEGGPVGCV